MALRKLKCIRRTFFVSVCSNKSFIAITTTSILKYYKYFISLMKLNNYPIFALIYIFLFWWKSAKNIIQAKINNSLFWRISVNQYYFALYDIIISNTHGVTIISSSHHNSPISKIIFYYVFTSFNRSCLLLLLSRFTYDIIIKCKFPFSKMGDVFCDIITEFNFQF